MSFGLLMNRLSCQRRLDLVFALKGRTYCDACTCGTQQYRGGSQWSPFDRLPVADVRLEESMDCTRLGTGKYAQGMTFTFWFNSWNEGALCTNFRSIKVLSTTVS